MILSEALSSPPFVPGASDRVGASCGSTTPCFASVRGASDPFGASFVIILLVVGSVCGASSPLSVF